MYVEGLLIRALRTRALTSTVGIWALNERTIDRGVDPSGQSCPESHPIKGNITDTVNIFNEPGRRYYESTVPERCLASAKDAEGNGFRASRVN